MLLLIDNFDSFTYNLWHCLLAHVSCKVESYTNDAARLVLLARSAKGVVVSPGPGSPADYPALQEVIAHCAAEKKPILGICLGHQAIGEWAGGTTKKAARPVFGHGWPVRAVDDILYKGVEKTFTAARYHSLCTELSAATEVEATAWAEGDGAVMSLRHRHLPIHAMQFHPESVLCPEGPKMIANWAEYCTNIWR